MRKLSKADFARLAAFRYELRRFLRFSEEATRRNGVTPLQYALMLQIRGFPDREWATSVWNTLPACIATNCSRFGLASRCPAWQSPDKCRPA
jgi:hypothetical protein